jgi:aminopeptidase N
MSYVCGELFENIKVWRFAKTALISTYLFGFVAGEYDEVKASGPYLLKDDSLPPMRVFCRSILKPHM